MIISFFFQDFANCLILYIIMTSKQSSSKFDLLCLSFEIINLLKQLNNLFKSVYNKGYTFITDLLVTQINILPNIPVV